MERGVLSNIRMRIQLGNDNFLKQRNIAGQRVGLLTNYASFTSDDVHVVDAFRDAGPKSLLIFGPEHGFWGEVQYMEEGAVAPYRDVPVSPMYGGDSGHHLFPSPKDVAALDVLVVDLQDVGARYYTFYASMINCMEVAAVVGTPVVVLDRPNPINGITVEGNRLRSPFISFVGQYPLPNRHGLTIGELAIYLNQLQGIGCDLNVVWMDGWSRDMWWDETGLRFVNPSPNLAHFETAIVYPGMCLFEGTQLSEGRGTTRPFEVFGAPWLDPFAYTDKLNALDLPGIRFTPFVFLPQFEKHARQRCFGARIVVRDREALRSLEAAAWAIKIARDMDPPRFAWRETMYEFANCSAIDTLTGGVAFRSIIDTDGDLAPLLARWRDDAAQFTKAKAAFEHPGYAPASKARNLQSVK
jgi:uncharacterized protein YbbC (DUF1343 family)